MKIMTRYEAFKLMFTEGVKIRSNTGNAWTYLYVENGKVYDHSGSERNYGTLTVGEEWFNTESQAWHVVEEPKQVPLTAGDLNARTDLRIKSTCDVETIIMSIVSYDDTCVYIGDCEDIIKFSYEEVKNCFVWLDGTPCSKEG